MKNEKQRLDKELSTWNVYAIALAPTLSSGFFLLPGLVYDQAGPSLILGYLLAAVLVVPAICSKVELATAMPRAGGVYYFLDRSLGPLVGTIGGLGTWMVMILKTAFALVGIGAYLGLIWPSLSMGPLVVVLALLFGVVNLAGAKASAKIQGVLVIGLLAVLLWYSGMGVFELNAAYFTGFFTGGIDGMLATVGTVYISFAGMTKVASVAEEVQDPEHVLPRGIFLALGTTVLVYTVGLLVLVGVLSSDQLAGNLAPIAAAARELTSSTWGVYLVVGAALLGFLGTANAGILGASRYPLALSRDRLLPKIFGRLNSRNVPTWAVAASTLLVIGVLSGFDPMKIAKLAGAFQLIVFGLLCLAVLVMRESQITEYDPGYRSPAYPWLQVVGVVIPLWIIGMMGWWSILFSAGLAVVAVAWYYLYGRAKIDRQGALYHVFHRLGEHRDQELHVELRGILQEKGPRAADPVNEVITRAEVLDIDPPATFEQIARSVAERLTSQISDDRDALVARFMKEQEGGFTPVARGTLLPHLHLEGLDHPHLVLVRSQEGLQLADVDQPVYMLSFLLSPADEPSQHLRMLAYIAERVGQTEFLDMWRKAPGEQALKELFFREERFRSLPIEADGPTARLIGASLNAHPMPQGVWVVLIRRGGEVLVPDKRAVLQEGDVLTVVGEPDALEKLDEFAPGEIADNVFEDADSGENGF